MPIYDYQCDCGNIEERYARINEYHTPCSKCGRLAERIISMRGHHSVNEDAEWIRSVTEVVSADSSPEAAEFKARPTRTNMRRWMRAEGLRHVENEGGGPPSVRKPPDRGVSMDAMMAAYKRRTAIEVR